MISIVFEPENHRAAVYGGDKLVGVCNTSPSQTVWIIDHTEVDPAYNGQGIAAKLVKAVVDAAREAKVKIVPLCPYAPMPRSSLKKTQNIRICSKPSAHASALCSL